MALKMGATHVINPKDEAARDQGMTNGLEYSCQLMQRPLHRPLMTAGMYCQGGFISMIGMSPFNVNVALLKLFYKT